MVPRWTAVAQGVLLLVLTFAAHFPAIHAGIIWDDNLSLYENPAVLAPDGLYRMWFTSETIDYWPLTYTTYWLEWRLWGNNPQPYHIANIILHGLAAIVLWRVLKRLGLGIGAFLGSLLFAIHPATVESVAWISERKNVLSMVLYLASILAYLRFEDEHRRAWYALALLTAVAALLAKTSVVALPIVLLLLTWYRGGKLNKQSLLEMIPFFLFSLLLGVATFWFHHHHAIAGVVVRPEGLASRIASVGWVVWFYLYKLVVPIDLLMIYPRWTIDGSRIVSFVPLCSLLLFMFIFWRHRHSWAHGLLTAVGSFIIVLAPVLGIMEMSYARYSLVADHLQYPGIPVIMALFGGGIAAAYHWARDKSSRHHRTFLTSHFSLLFLATVIAAFSTLFVLTWRQANLYADSITLWSHVISNNDGALAAYYNRGKAYRESAQYELAIRDFSSAIEIDAHDAEAYNCRGALLINSGTYEAALYDFSRALAINPNDSKPYYNLGIVYSRLGNLDKAIESYTQAIRLKPDHVAAYSNRATVYDRKGSHDLAIQDCTQAIVLQPTYADAYINRGTIYSAKGEFASAILEFNKAIELKTANAQVYNNRAAAFFGMKEYDKAWLDLRQCRQLSGTPNPLLVQAVSKASGKTE